MDLHKGGKLKCWKKTWTQTAWGPAHGLIEKLSEKFNLTYLYFAEEPGSGIYETNDREGLYFSDRFIIEQCDEKTVYYTDIQEALDDIACRTNRTCVDMESAQKIIDDYNSEHENKEITLIKITVL